MVQVVKVGLMLLIASSPVLLAVAVLFVRDRLTFSSGMSREERNRITQIRSIRALNRWRVFILCCAVSLYLSIWQTLVTSRPATAVLRRSLLYFLSLGTTGSALKFRYRIQPALVTLSQTIWLVTAISPLIRSDEVKYPCGRPFLPALPAARWDRGSQWSGLPTYKGPQAAGSAQ